MEQTLYLNNDGSRWIIVDTSQRGWPKARRMRAWLVDAERGYRKLRTVKYFESYGHFATYNFDYHGKMVSLFAEDFLCWDIDGNETDDRAAGYAVCYI
jgi:hypothetical protein